MAHTGQSNTRPYFDRSNLIGFDDPFWRMSGKLNNLSYYNDDEIDKILSEGDGKYVGEMTRLEGALYASFSLCVDYTSGECLWEICRNGGLTLIEASEKFNQQYPNQLITR